MDTYTQNNKSLTMTFFLTKNFVFQSCHIIFHIDRLLNLIWDDLDPPKKGQNVVTLSLASSQPLLNPSLPCGLAIVIS